MPRFLVALFCALLVIGDFSLAQEEMDKAAIPRPGAARMRRESEERQARILERRAAMDAARADAEARVARAQGKEVTEESAEEASEEGEEGEGTETTDGDEESAAASDAVAGAIPPEMAELLPVGAVFKGVRFPNYQEDRLASVVNAEEMFRIDTEHLDLKKLVIDMLREDGAVETKIYMDRAVYDLTDRKLISRSRATIEQEKKFVMKGDKMVFNAESQDGKMVGNVRTIIYNVKKASAGAIK